MKVSHRTVAISCDVSFAQSMVLNGEMYAKLSHDHVNDIARMLYRWSPSETRRAENYYGSRALDVYGLLRDGQDVRRVASYLGRIRIAEIGLCGR